MSAGRHLIDAKHLLRTVGVLPGMHLADFGVGHSGHIVMSAAGIIGDEGRVYAVDVMPQLLDLLNSRLRMHNIANAQTVHGNYQSFCGVPIKPNTLDYVISLHNLWHVGDLPAMTREAHRLLKPDGKFVLVDWHHNSYHPIAKSIQNLVPHSEAKRQLVNAGFHRLEEVPLDNHHWGYIVTT